MRPVRFGIVVWMILLVGGDARGVPPAQRDSESSGAAGRARVWASGPRDWPMWGRTASRSFYSPGERAPVNWDVTTGVGIKWMAALGSHCFSTPVVCDGVVYVGTNNERKRDPKFLADAGVLMAFGEFDGRFLWQRCSAKLPSGRVNDWVELGLISTACVESASGRLWYCTNRCEVVCLDVHDHEKPRELWSLDMMKSLGVFPHNMTTCSPMLWGDFGYVITANGVDDAHRHVVAPQAPSIICFEKSTGRMVWKDNSPGKNILHSQWSNPTLAQARGRTLVIAALGDAWVYAFDATTGRIVWTFDGNLQDAVYPQTRNEIVATPIILGQRMYIAMGQDPEHGEGYGRLWCVDINGEGDVSAELPADPTVPKFAIEGGNNAVRRGRANPNSHVVWQYDKFDLNNDGRFERSEHMNRTISSAAIDPVSKLLFAADFSGFLHCLDATTGQVYWTHDLESAVWGCPLVCDGKVYVADEDGDVVVMEAAKQEHLLATNPMGSAIHSTPIFANGVMYVATHDKLFAIEKR